MVDKYCQFDYEYTYTSNSMNIRSIDKVITCSRDKDDKDDNGVALPVSVSVSVPVSVSTETERDIMNYLNKIDTEYATINNNTIRSDTMIHSRRVQWLSESRLNPLFIAQLEVGGSDDSNNENSKHDTSLYNKYYALDDIKHMKLNDRVVRGESVSYLPNQYYNCFFIQ